MLMVENSFLPGTFAVVLAAIFKVEIWQEFHWSSYDVCYGLALGIPLAMADMLLFLPQWAPPGEVELRGSSMILGAQKAGETEVSSTGRDSIPQHSSGASKENAPGAPADPPPVKNPRLAAFRKGITLWQAERAKTNPGPMLGLLGEGILIVGSHFSESLFVCCQMHIIAEFIHGRFYEIASLDSPNHWLWIEILEKQHLVPMVGNEFQDDIWTITSTITLFIGVEIARRWKLLSGKVTPSVNVVRVNKVTGKYDVESTNLGAALTNKELSASTQSSIAIAAAAQRWSKAINEGRDIFEGFLFAVAYTTSGFNIVPALALSVSIDTAFSVWQRVRRSSNFWIMKRLCA